MAIRVKTGMKFRAAYAGSCPTWTVGRRRGRGVYQCRVEDEDDEYCGATRLFESKEIRALLEREAKDRAREEAHEDFYASLKEGDVVHYHRGFGEFERCEVVSTDGQIMLRSFALVGAWPTDVVEDKPTHLGRLFVPHASNIYEHFHGPLHLDPAKLAPLVEVPRSIHR